MKPCLVIFTIVLLVHTKCSNADDPKAADPEAKDPEAEDPEAMDWKAMAALKIRPEDLETPQLIELQDLIKRYVCKSEIVSEEDTCFEVGNHADDWLYNVCHDRLHKVCSIFDNLSHRASCTFYLYHYVCKQVDVLTRQTYQIHEETGSNKFIPSNNPKTRAELSMLGQVVTSTCERALKKLDRDTRKNLSDSIKCQDAIITFSELCEVETLKFCEDIPNLFLQGLCRALAPHHLCDL